MLERRAASSAARLAASPESLIMPARPARLLASRISATRPSPMRVAPAYRLIPRSCLPSGLTTISSVSSMSSTTRPNWRSSACSTAMNVVSCVDLLAAELLAQVDQRQQRAAQPVDRGALDVLQALGSLLPVEAHQLQQVDLRDREHVLVTADEERRDDRQRQRDLDADRGALAGDRADDVDDAADLLDVRLDDVHADAAAGDVGDRPAVEKPGRKIRWSASRSRQPVGLLAGHADCCSTALSRSLSGSMPAPSSMISMLTWPPSWKARRSRRPSAGLPLATPHLRRLDAVVAGVADQVGQRVLDRLEDRLVELGVLALHVDADLLAARVRQVAHDAGDLGPDVVDGLHARLHDALLQLTGDEVEAVHATRMSSWS